MTEHHPDVTDLVAELEEELSFDGTLGLYNFTWFQDVGSRPAADRPQIIARAEAAYDAVTSRHPELRLVWVDWPIDVTRARPVKEETPLDFELDPEAPAGTPLLALIAPTETVSDTGMTSST